MRDPDDVAVLSVHAARIEAERHRRELTDAIAQLGHRVSDGLHDVEEQVTMPLRWARAHPFAALALGTAAGLLLARRDTRKEEAPLAASDRDLEGAYLVGRRDETEHRPPRDPHYWSASPAGRPATTPRDLFWIFAEPLVRGLAERLGEHISRRISGG